MTENDYIAEYIKDKYPSLLGVDFALWKFVKQMRYVATDIVKTFSQVSKEDLEEAIANMDIGGNTSADER